MRAPTTAVSSTALAGTLRVDTLDHSRDPGMAPSRLKANVMREQLVMQATVQKNCPAVEMTRIVPAHPVESASVKMTGAKPPASVIVWGSWTAKTNESNKM